jgi:hypothetical protein
MGPQDRVKRRIPTQVIQNIQPNPGRTNRTRQIPEGESRKGLHSTLAITHGNPILFCKEERWETPTLPGLSITERMDDQERLSLTPHLRTHRQIKDAKYFTKLDVRLGYNNVRIRDGDQWKAAFKTNKGLFKPTVMFFGMCNSPATFQSMMDDIFGDLIDTCI